MIKSDFVIIILHTKRKWRQKHLFMGTYWFKILWGEFCNYWLKTNDNHSITTWFESLHLMNFYTIVYGIIHNLDTFSYRKPRQTKYISDLFYTLWVLSLLSKYFFNWFLANLVFLIKRFYSIAKLNKIKKNIYSFTNITSSVFG